MIRSIRTSPHTARRVQPHENTDAQAIRLVAKMLRELLQQQTFVDVSDLKEALKCRCARLKIRGYHRLVPCACDLVASNRSLVAPRARRQFHVDMREAARPLSRSDAAALTRSLGLVGAMRGIPRTFGRIVIDGPVRDVVDIESLVGGGR